MWVLSAFSKSGNCNLCVYFLFWFLSPRQAATKSYPALAYFRAVHRNGTNQEVKKKKKYNKKKINNSNKEKVQRTTNFGIDVHPVSSSNKQ